MGYSEVKISSEKCGLLLSKEILDNLQKQYLDYMLQNYENWMRKTIETEKVN